MTTEQTSSLLGNSAQVNNIHYTYETEFMDEKMDSLEKEQRRMLSLVEAEKDDLDENNFFPKGNTGYTFGYTALTGCLNH